MKQSRTVSRRSFLTAAAAGSFTILARAQKPAEYRFSQYHNQTADSPLHLRLVEMWTAVRNETGGRVETQVFPQNNKNPGSDPAVLKMLVSGEIQFFTLMGGILGNVVPVADVQQVPFAFRSAAHAHRTIDGPLGAYLREEMAAKGILGFPVGAFDNGMRQIGGRTRADPRAGRSDGPQDARPGRARCSTTCSGRSARSRSRSTAATSTPRSRAARWTRRRTRSPTWICSSTTRS